MKQFICCIIVLWLIRHEASAIIVSQFGNTDGQIKWSKDIIIAECVSIPTNKAVFVDGHWVEQTLRDGLYKVEVNVIQTLKGDKLTGKQIIATIYPMVPGKRYLLSSIGGGVGETGGIPATDFLAVPELSVVEIPSNFDLKTLEGKGLKEQMQSIFSRHLFDVERKLAPLLEEQRLLEKSVADRQYEWFDSHGPVKIGQVIETNTTNKNWDVWIELAGRKLPWSGSMPGKDGYFCFQNLGYPCWEFSTSNATNIESLVDNPLKTKFSGMYSPGTDGNAFRVSVGQVLLARTSDDLSKIFVIQILRQAENQEQMFARYAIIQH
jgi:hypothetical protein